MYRDTEVELSVRVLGVHEKAYLIKIVLYWGSWDFNIICNLSADSYKMC